MKRQMSETILIGYLLAVSGGLMDAYSYIFRDKVFANAQTGNIILFGIHISEGNTALALSYFYPIISFVIGIIIADFVKHISHKFSLHWRQVALFAEILILCGVAFISTDNNLLANSLTSLACGIQLESFRKINSHPIATTMCIGNLRSGTENLYAFLFHKEKINLEKAILYYGIIFFFVIGAVISNFLIKIFQEKAILFSPLILFIVFLLMFFEYDESLFLKRLKINRIKK